MKQTRKEKRLAAARPERQHSLDQSIRTRA